MTLELIVQQNESGRIDAYIAGKVNDLSRSMIQKLIKNGGVILNGKTVKANKSVKEGDVIVINKPQPQPSQILPQDIPLDIIYQDEHIAVINKQRGLSVHPAGTNRSNTLVNALLYHIKDLSCIGGVIRPGIVHRLDKNTTGLIVVAKNDSAHNNLSRQISSKKCRRIYRALCEGIIKQDSGEIDAPIGRSLRDRKKMDIVLNGRPARTFYKVLKRFKNNTYAEFELVTGRTHQIRVHLKHTGHPVVCDDVYGYKKQRFNIKGQLLHSYKLILTHPVTKEVMEFTAPLPSDFQNVLEILEYKEYIG